MKKRKHTNLKTGVLRKKKSASLVVTLYPGVEVQALNETTVMECLVKCLGRSLLPIPGILKVIAGLEGRPQTFRPVVTPPMLSAHFPLFHTPTDLRGFNNWNIDDVYGPPLGRDAKTKYKGNRSFFCGVLRGENGFPNGQDGTCPSSLSVFFSAASAAPDSKATLPAKIPIFQPARLKWQTKVPKVGTTYNFGHISEDTKFHKCPPVFHTDPIEAVRSLNLAVGGSACASSKRKGDTYPGGWRPDDCRIEGGGSTPFDTFIVHLLKKPVPGVQALFERETNFTKYHNEGKAGRVLLPTGTTLSSSRVRWQGILDVNFLSGNAACPFGSYGMHHFIRLVVVDSVLTSSTKTQTQTQTATTK